jgi:urate oxidase
VLERFEQLESVRFESKNHTWIGVRDDLKGDGEVLREPSRPTGFQQFSMDHSELDEEDSK